MKRVNTKTSKRIVAIVLAAVAAFSVMGCSATQTVTTTETHTDANGNTVIVTSTQTTDKNGKVKSGTMDIAVEPAKDAELVSYEFETYDNVKVVIDETNIVAQKTCEDPEHSDLIPDNAVDNIIAPGRDYVYLEGDDYYYVADLYRNLITVADKCNAVVDAANDDELAENPGFFETDLWSITYDTDKWYGYVNEEGNTIINYLGECAGTSFIEISDTDCATASDAVAMLEEKTGKELSVIVAEDGAEYTCMAYVPDEVYGTGLYIADFYTIYERNGKVIIVDEAVTHVDDEANAESLAEVFLAQKNELILK